MTRGRCGSLFLHRVTLSFTTPRRFNPAHGGPTMTTWGQVLGGLVIFVVLVVLVVLLACAGWVGAQKYRESVEQRASFEAGRCRLVAIRYDAIYDSGHIVRDCPTVDGGTRKVTSPVTWTVLKEEVNRF